MVPSGADVGDSLNIAGNIVSVLVGPETTVLNVHENLVRSRSTFFEAALKKCWQEGREARLHLPEDAHEIVKLYFQFLYAHKLFINWTRRAGELSRNANFPEYITLAHLYVFGEKVGDVMFKNAVVDAFIRRAITPVGDRKWNPVTKAVDIIYRGTMSGSPARRLMVDVHLYGGEDSVMTFPLLNC